ncbi:MAG: extracellular solute-binding protein [Defluviitaleaceae bacterium]|nr:extracellular solute-binding protein [Defluviitaleaceae bacterium]
MATFSTKRYMPCKKIMCWLLAIVMIGGYFASLPVVASAELTGGLASTEGWTIEGGPDFMRDEAASLTMFEEMLAEFGVRHHFTDFLIDSLDMTRPESAEENRAFFEAVFGNLHTVRPTLAQDIIIDAADYALIEGMEIRHEENWRDMPGTSLWTCEQGLVEWEFYIAEAGLYNLSVTFYNYPGRSSDIQRAVFINGELPFFEANPVELRRSWVNALDEIQQDEQGNDMRPVQVEQHLWQESIIRDSMGTYNEPLMFHFDAGYNRISFVSLREPMVIRQLRIHQVPEVLPYAQVAAQRGTDLPRPTRAQVEPIRIEGQDAVRKSSPMLAPAADTGGPGVYPYSARYIRVNHIGGGSWSEPGTWIEWEVYVPVAGLYSMAMNVRQNIHRGASSFRRITVNGEVPFTSMEAVPFHFQNGWRVERFGGDDPYLFWFDAGVNVIRMETVLGDYAPILREIQESVMNLNEMYREVIMITGLTPDRWRDYRINHRLPHLRGGLMYERERLDRLFADLVELSGERGGRDAIVRNMSNLLTILYSDIESIPLRIGDFRINIGSMGTWMMMVREQSLAVDAIYILPHDAPDPENGSSWWRQILHEILTLFWSFFIDYNSLPSPVAGQDAITIEVWIGTGRDQANIIRSLIDESFTPETNIGVELMLVQADVILPATVARQGPDVVLSIWNTLPMDYGLRGAVADISNMPGFDEVEARFHPAAMEAYRFYYDGNERVFALPETMTFPMLFYRRDILHEIGLQPPDTWDDVRNSIARLSQFHMDFGIPVNAPGNPPVDLSHEAFMMFLFQAGGTLYNEDNTRSALDDYISLNAFRDFTRFFTDYNLDEDYNFINRFRMGEMPLAIANYGDFNVLQVFAPEIRGLWGFRPVPATLREDGTYSRAVPVGGAATVMMENADDKYAAWEFMKWWTSAETQTQFGRRMEALMGAAARHPTANLESFSHMPWAVADYNQLLSQMHYVQGVPQIPGAYFTPRQIRNAFFTVVTLEEVAPRDALTDFTRLINDEIRAKRREFGMTY